MTAKSARPDANRAADGMMRALAEGRVRWGFWPPGTTPQREGQGLWLGQYEEIAESDPEHHMAKLNIKSDEDVSPVEEEEEDDEEEEEEDEETEFTKANRASFFAALSPDEDDDEEDDDDELYA